MSKTTIPGSTTTVTLNSGNSPLYNSGIVDPTGSGYGATGVESSVYVGASLTNESHIYGSCGQGIKTYYGTDGGTGGIGVEFTAAGAGSVTNYGEIKGGAGGYGIDLGGTGRVGVSLAGATSNVAAAASSIELRSRSLAPAQVNPAKDDPRSLGICVGRLQLDGIELAPTDESAFARGWHLLEGNGDEKP